MANRDVDCMLRGSLRPQHFRLASLTVSFVVSQVWGGGNLEAGSVDREGSLFRVLKHELKSTCRTHVERVTRSLVKNKLFIQLVPVSVHRIS